MPHLNQSITTLRLSNTCQFWIASIFIGAAALLSFACSYDGDFVFDDSEAIVNNADVKSETPISNLLVNDFWGKKLMSNTSHKSYRPITVLSFRLNFWLAGGLHPTHFHVINIVLHVIVSLFILHIFHEIFHRPCFLLKPHEHISIHAIFSALLFALHPVHSESVSGVVGRADLLCAVWFCLSFHLYMSCCSKDVVDGLCPLLISMLCCILAVLCKEQGITVLGVCCIYDITQFLYAKSTRELQRTKVREKASGQVAAFAGRHCIMVVTGVGIFLHRWYIMQSAPPTFTPHDNPHSFINDTFLRFINYNYIYSINSALLVFPHWLCFDWSMGCVPTLQSITDPRIFSVLIFWIIYAMILASSIKRKMTKDDRIVIVGLSLIIIPFLPASNLFLRVGFVVAERALYLPISGYALIISIGIKKLHRRLQGKLQYVMASGMVVVLLAFMSKCVKRSIEWRSEMDLFSSGEKVCPLNAKLQYNIGKVHADRGNIDFAIKKYRLAISLNPDYDQPYNNLGVLLKDRGELQEAERLLTVATRITPQMAAAWMNLGITQAELKKFAMSERSYLTAIHHRRNYPHCYYNLGNLYMAVGKHMEAIESWKKAILLQPTHLNAWNNLVLHLDTLGNTTEAISTARNALAHLPQEPLLLYTFANCLGKAGHYDEGERVYKQLLILQPHNADGYANLGVLYHRWGKLKKAEAAYKLALELYPEAENVRSNYDMLLKRMGQ